MIRSWAGTTHGRIVVWWGAAVVAASLCAPALGVAWYRGAILAAIAAGIGGAAVWRHVLLPLQRLAARHCVTAVAAPEHPLPRDSIQSLARQLDALASAIQARDTLIREAEETIRNNEARYRELFDRNPHPMIVFDVDTLEILAANDAAIRRYGFTREQFLRLTIRHLLPEPILPGRTVLLERMALDHEQPREDVHRRRDGTLMDVEVASHRIRFAGRSAAVAMLLDISLRKQAQEKARRHTEMLAALSDAARDQTSSLNPRQVAGAVVRAAVRRFGGCAAWIAVQDQPAELEVLAVSPWPEQGGFPRLAIGQAGPSAQVLRDRRSVTYVVADNLTQEGPWLPETFPASCRHGLAMPLVAHDQPYGVLHVLGVHEWASEPELLGGLEGLALHASTALSNALAHEQLRSQADLLEQRVRERTAELEAANRELEAFAYSVSHDLRAPLRSIEGFSRLLLSDHGHEIPEEGRRYLSFIRYGALEMDELIQGLLAFSRAGRHPLCLSSVEPRDLVDAILRSLHYEIGERQIEFRIGELPPCTADRTLLKQVFANLISNAIKYTSRRDRALVEIGAFDDEGTTVYYVRDNGAGFDPTQGERVFQVFQRLHSADEFPGSGIGLATVHRILMRHGGRIWYETAPDMGATFYFSVGTLGTESPSSL